MSTFRRLRHGEGVVLVGRCDCGQGHRVEAEPGHRMDNEIMGSAAFRRLDSGSVALAVANSHADGCFGDCRCGRRVRLRKLRATHNPERNCCGACMAATGAVCDCSCGGANHGIMHGG